MADVTPGNNNRFGPYLVQGKLGGGGMAIVYKALNEETSQVVALKVLRASLAEQPGIVDRFKQEATIANRLRHQHIVAVNSYGVLRGRFYLELQYMPGGTLARRFKNPVEIGPQEAVRLLRHIASALDYAHKQGVVHRDLKLENILLDGSGNAALSDFGIARLVDGTRLTATGSVIGTPLYLSPEAARGETVLDYRSDLYSLAVIAYVLTVGRFPFFADNMLTILNQHVNEPVPTPSRVNPNLPAGVDAVLLKGMGKRREDRYPSADTFVEALARAWSTEGKPNSTLIDLWSDHSSKPIVIQKAVHTPQTANEWVEAASNAASQAEAISALKQALALEPLHSKANRMLFQLEGARSLNSKAPAKPVSPPVAPVELEPLKKVSRPKRKRSVWTYVGIAAFILSSLTTTFIVLSFQGNRTTGDLVNFLLGNRPVNDIDGTPVQKIPNVVLTVQPNQTKEVRTGQRLGDTLDHGIAHQYYFDANAGEEVNIGVWFVSPSANQVARNVAVIDPQGIDARALCQAEQFIPGADTNIGFICRINQTGRWQVRLFGIEGQSTGAYFVTIERGG
jgi:serine/threonine protein kinase